MTAPSDLAQRSLRVAMTGSVPDDDPTIIADMQAEIDRLRAICQRISDISDDRRVSELALNGIHPPNKTSS